MRLLGFNFKKISVEKKKDSLKDLKIDTRIDVSNIEKVDSEMVKPDEVVLRVKFIYELNYNPEIAEMELGGNVLIGTDKKQAEDILNDWKGKKIPEEFKIAIFNVVLRKSNVKALDLEEQMGLPLHLPLPTVKKQQK